MQKLYKWIKSKFFRSSKEDSRLENKRGFRNGGRGIKERLNDIWDASGRPRLLEKALRQRILREGAAEAARERTEKLRARSARLSDLVANNGWEQDILPFLKSQEFQALSLIRRPSSRDKDVSPEHWIGIQEGRLEMIEALRVFVYSSITSFTEEQLKDEIESLA